MKKIILAICICVCISMYFVGNTSCSNYTPSSNQCDSTCIENNNTECMDTTCLYMLDTTCTECN